MFAILANESGTFLVDTNKPFFLDQSALSEVARQSGRHYGHLVLISLKDESDPVFNFVSHQSLEKTSYLLLTGIRFLARVYPEWGSVAWDECFQVISLGLLSQGAVKPEGEVNPYVLELIKMARGQ